MRKRLSRKQVAAMFAALSPRRFEHVVEVAPLEPLSVNRAGDRFLDSVDIGMWDCVYGPGLSLTRLDLLERSDDTREPIFTTARRIAYCRPYVVQKTWIDEQIEDDKKVAAARRPKEPKRAPEKFDLDALEQSGYGAFQWAFVDAGHRFGFKHDGSPAWFVLDDGRRGLECLMCEQSFYLTGAQPRFSRCPSFGKKAFDLG